MINKSVIGKQQTKLIPMSSAWLCFGLMVWPSALIMFVHAPWKYPAAIPVMFVVAAVALYLFSYSYSSKAETASLVISAMVAALIFLPALAFGLWLIVEVVETFYPNGSEAVNVLFNCLGLSYAILALYTSVQSFRHAGRVPALLLLIPLALALSALVALQYPFWPLGVYADTIYGDRTNLPLISVHFGAPASALTAVAVLRFQQKRAVR